MCSTATGFDSISHDFITNWTDEICWYFYLWQLNFSLFRLPFSRFHISFSGKYQHYIRFQSKWNAVWGCVRQCTSLTCTLKIHLRIFLYHSISILCQNRSWGIRECWNHKVYGNSMSVSDATSFWWHSVKYWIVHSYNYIVYRISSTVAYIVLCWFSNNISFY